MTMKQNEILECLLRIHEALEDLSISRDSLDNIREDLEAMEENISTQISNLYFIVTDFRDLLDDEHLEKLDAVLEGIVDE